MVTKFDELAGYLWAFLAFPILSFFVLKLTGRTKWIVFGLLNVFSCFAVVGLLKLPDWVTDENRIPWFLKFGPIFFSSYVALVLGCYGLLALSQRRSQFNWMAYSLPILMLFTIRDFAEFAHFRGFKVFVMMFLGISYLSFRLCHLVTEVKNEVVDMPTVWEYLAFAFYVPIMFVGPITRYSVFKKSIDERAAGSENNLRAVTRIGVGVVKYFFLSAVLSQLTYGGAFLSDGHPHSHFDLVLAMLIYPAYLYMNFSGMCDVAIGVSGLIGIEIMENFNRPFAARNFQEFWSRWHMTLSSWTRDLIFTPFVKALSRKFGIKHLQHISAVAILLIFLVIGLWHGVSTHFIVFGVTQAIGVIAVHYSTIALRKKLGKEGFIKYRANRFFYGMGVTGSYLYFAVTLFFFANTFQDAHLILSNLR